MHKKHILLTAVLGLAAITSHAQNSINGLYSPITENFDSFEGTEITIPANFTFSDADYNPGGYYDLAGSYSNSNSTYALIDSNVSSTDVAFGQKGPTSGTDFLNWSFTNNTGTAIEQFNVSWDFEQYSAATRETALNFNYNPNSSGWTTDGIAGSFSSTATLGANVNLSSVGVESKMVTVTLTTPLQDGEGILFGWGFQFGAGSGSNAHIGVDNLSVTAIPEPSMAALLVLGIALVARFLRKR
ncbi:MAG: hypothetical protein PF795_01510 [Kiritimatiellae bacterium]|jgi:hypothetical protein|nr:hypothetical protein [Kiritimatiellia bacterium]